MKRLVTVGLAVLLVASCSNGVPEVAGERTIAPKPAPPNGVTQSEWDRSDEVLDWQIGAVAGLDDETCDHFARDDHEGQRYIAIFADMLADRLDRPVSVDYVNAYLDDFC